MVEIVPTILVHSKDEFIKRLELVAPYVSRVQWDIMDGHFVPNTTFSDPLVFEEIEEKELWKGPDPDVSLLKIEADLMVQDPERWVELLKHPWVDRLIFHVESKGNHQGWLELIQEAESKSFSVGVTLDPDTPLERVWKFLPKVDLFQAMGVKSGFGGQKFVPSVLGRIREVRDAFPNLPISVDGGVNVETSPGMVAAGATELCAGSAIFESDNVDEAIKALEDASSNV
ncbi:hypothetical protein GTO10_01585 [Candidatus Saccharibacteria bacterium]|nr:hypothetical protein [Candidatus Saccharibacteria bacterium]